MSLHPTADELMAALPGVLQAPKSGSAVELLCLRPGYGQRRFVDSLSVTRDQGIPGERWGTAPWLKLPDGTGHPGIQVSILPRRVLDLVWRDRESQLHPGDTFVSDLDTSEANLPEGQLLAVGTALLRVSEVWNDGCAKWKVRYGEAAYDWIRAPGHKALRLRGILCSIERDGVIRNGDPVQVLRQDAWKFLGRSSDAAIRSNWLAPHDQPARRDGRKTEGRPLKDGPVLLKRPD